MMKRLSWKQIQEKHPDKWVALKDVEYEDLSNIKSAIVICSMSDKEYIDKRLSFIREGKDYTYERTYDLCNFVGVDLC